MSQQSVSDQSLADQDASWVSSRQAAEILGVHESSVKRWCNADRLPTSRTAGGHRRIAFDDLLEFARREDMRTDLEPFNPGEFDVWRAGELSQHGDFSELADRYYEALLEGDSTRANNLLRYTAARGAKMVDILQYVTAGALKRIGNAWSMTDIDTGDEHRMSAHIHDGIEMLRHTFRSSDQEHPDRDATTDRKVAVVGCPSGETHVLGAMMVRAVLESNGWNVIYLGGDTPIEDFVAQQSKFGATAVCISIVPPRGVATAARLVSALSQLDPEGTFDIVLGGGARPSDLSGLSSRANRKVHWFDTLPGFARWVGGHN